MIELREETGHPSRWMLSRLAAGDLAADEGRDLRAHADGCPECGAFLASAAAEREEFTLSPTRRRVAEALRGEVARSAVGWWSRLGVRRWLAPAGALAAAAVALLLVVRPGIPGERGKGSGEFEFAYKVLIDGQVQPGESGQPLESGARIQFVYGAPTGGFLYVLGVDSRGRVTQYYPAPGADSAEVAPGWERPLSHSVILDDAAAERVFALLCHRPLAAGELAVVLQGGDATAWLQAERLPVDPCQQQILDLPRRQR